MSSNINKPTGLGFHSNLQRLCTICGHVEMDHYGNDCYGVVDWINDCICPNFCARELTEEERRIILDKRIVELEYVDEAYILDLKEDWKKVRIEGIDD